MTASKRSRQSVIHRLARLEGQVQGIRRMVEGGKGCVDVITQIMAARSALSMLGVELLKDGLICQKGGQEHVDEKVLKKLFIIQ